MIEMRTLTKRFGERTAVDALTVTVRSGVVTGFLGPNGAGKSTTLRMVLGLDLPTAGTVAVAGRRYAELDAPLRTVGGVLDPTGLHPGRRGADHLAALAASNGLSRRRVAEVLDQVELTSVAEQRAGDLSLGMRQRLVLAAALLGDPAVLVLDEPINGLDTTGVRWLRTLLRRFAAEGRTVLLSSHLMSEMQQTADHLLVLHAGRLIADVPMQQLLQQARPAVAVRSPQAEQLRRLLTGRGAQVVHNGADALTVTGLDASRVGEAARAAGIGLHELRGEQPALEDVYLQMIAAADGRRAAAGAA
ncbi:ATP-binding cassette domain-containing protein [Geodermatophilus marinus]|nr:ATP-binding cassette domain-containing protein [Geodermatophilus sp. LHW52908]RFU19002.1 ATP-binding cassette domain-containing protein [Geodermatophilus sp. LHW52908]